MVSLVSESLGGVGMPATFHRSVFHSSSRFMHEPVSKSSTRGPPSMSQRPYSSLTPRSRIAASVCASSGASGSIASTSIGADLYDSGPAPSALHATCDADR